MLTLRKVRIKDTLRFHFTPVRKQLFQACLSAGTPTSADKLWRNSAQLCPEPEDRAQALVLGEAADGRSP